VADGGARALEPGPAVRAPLAHRRDEHVIDIGLVGRRTGIGADAGKRRHGLDSFRELAQIDLDARVVSPDGDEALEPALVVDGAGDPDRLVGGAEVRVAADLDGDIAAQPAKLRQVVALRRLGQPPPDVQLVEPFRGPTAALDDQRGCPR
jgi:hypothetical protein